MDEFDAPQSRNEAILQNMLGANNTLSEPKSRIEKLLQEILEKGIVTTPESIISATDDMTSEQKAQTRENIGAGEPLTSEQIVAGAGTWLSENLDTPSTPPIDTTLSVASAAADAKAVGDEVSDLKSDLSTILEGEADGIVPIITEWTEGYYVNTNTGGLATASDSKVSAYIPVEPNESIYFLNTARESSTNAFYTSDKSFISTFIVYKDVNESKIDVPSTAYYMRVSVKIASPFDSMYRKNAILEALQWAKTLTDDDVESGFVNGSTGKLSSSGSWIASDYIPLPLPLGGQFYAASTLYGNGGTAFYDINKNFISGVNGNTASSYGFSSSATVKQRLYTVPENTFYVRICLYLYDSNYKASTMYLSSNFGLYDLSNTLEYLHKSIYALNSYENTFVNAGANYGHHASGSSNTNRRFTMLVTTDVHADETALERAVKYMDVMPAFTIGATLGDLQASTYSDNDGTWYTNIIKYAKRNWLTVIGNHDVGIGSSTSATGTEAEVYEKFISPNLEYADVTDTGHCYYYKDDSTYKIRVICLNAYDVDDNTISGDNYVVPRYTEYYSQAQIDWLVSTLNSIPSDYQVIVLTHNTPAAATKDTSVKFNNKVYNLSVETTQDGIITDIINAWQNGTTLSQTYTCTNTNLEDVTVSADFSSRGSGVFICYVTGHMHVDFVGAITAYPTQHIFAFSATNGGTYQNGNDDLPRADFTKSEDCITALSVDTSNKVIYITRIGANVSMYFDERKPSAISYA